MPRVYAPPESFRRLGRRPARRATRLFVVTNSWRMPPHCTRPFLDFGGFREVHRPFTYFTKFLAIPRNRGRSSDQTTFRTFEVDIRPERLHGLDSNHIVIALALNEHERRTSFGIFVRPDSRVYAPVLSSRTQVNLIALSTEELRREPLEVSPVNASHL